MGTHFIIVFMSILAYPTHFVEASEPVGVQALVAEAAVETLDEAVLHRLAGGDVVPLDRWLLGA